MKAITLAVAAVTAVACFTGCANLRTRTAPAKACLTNPCGGFGPCQTGACAPQMPPPQMMPPPPPQYAPPTLEK
jgi:hypothetical protein